MGLLTGIVGAAGGFGGFMLPNILGTLRDRSGTFGTGFAVLALLGCAGISALLYLGPVWRKRWTVESAIRAGLVKTELLPEESAA